MIKIGFACLVCSLVVVWTVEAQDIKTNAEGRITFIKRLGDETHIAEIRTYPTKYLEKPIILVGVVDTANYYNFGYENASTTHYSLKFTESTEDVKSLGDLDVYASRKFAKPLVDAILGVESKGGALLVRLEVKVTARSFQRRDFQEAVELVDWQLPNESKSGWSPWYFKSKAEAALTLKAKQDEENRRFAAIQQKQKQKAAADAALKHNVDLAAKGDAYGQLRMGERYLKGEGVEKDITKALDYLSKAAAQGNSQATLLLVQVTNSVASTPTPEK